LRRRLDGARQVVLTGDNRLYLKQNEVQGMKPSRFFLISLGLVLAVVLAACAPGVAPTLSAVGGILQNQTSSAQAVVANPAPVAVPPAQGVVVGADLQTALEQVYGQVNPSVVSIRVQTNTASQLQQMLPNMPNLPNLPNSPFRFFFGPNGPQSPRSPNTPQTPQVPQYSTALGSGFVWDTQGHIVTNNHVIDGANQIYVTFSDGTTVSAKVVGSDPDSDLAVLQIEDTSKVNLQPIHVGDSTTAKVGEFVIAIGNPFGLENTMTFGIISAIGRSIPANGDSSGVTGQPSYTIPDVIQTDAAVNPGNSGGVLLDLNGNLLGVPSQIESPVRANSGVGFAIPSAIVKNVVPALISQGKVEHPWIGISGGTLTPELAQAMNLPSTQLGALVSQVTPGSPAEKAGLHGSTEQATINGQQVPVGGDVIVAIDGQTVKQFDDLVTFLERQGKVGQQVQLTVIRNGQEMTIPLTLGARPSAQSAAPSQALPQQQQPQQQQPQQQQPQQQPGTQSNVWLGIQGMTLSSDLAQAMNLTSNQQGVLVETVVNGSPADNAGLRGSFKSVNINGQDVLVGGDVITAIDGTTVNTIQDLVTAIQGKKAGDTVQLTVIRNGQQVQVTATLAERPATTQ
jgi:serine protease Do